MLDTEQTILSNGMELNVERGEYLFRRRQEADYVFYVKGGTLELTGDEQQPHVLDHRACFLGLEEVLLDHCHRYDARALDHSVVLVFDKLLINALLSGSARVHRYFLYKMCDRLAQKGRGFE
ncbi:MAG: cyclic nucleotide-binding domain-containing protein [Sphingobacteriaceae bacterium]|nr:cyclic nucleotide-binding domain-containing protein [Cytophagaceae bacterium]